MIGGKFLRTGAEYLFNERNRGLRKAANILAVNHIIGTPESRLNKSLGGGAPLQQGEIRLNSNPYQDPKGGNREEEEGDFVPEIFRQNRHKYSSKPIEIGGYRRQIMYRAAHIGTKELEIVLADWLSLNMDNMSY